MQLDDFLKSAQYFSLGHLPTEMPHPETQDLSDLARSDLRAAIEKIRKIDLHAIEVVEAAKETLRILERDANNTIKSGGRVFISGCGATGRLALALEMIHRSLHGGDERANSVVALMAGGDFALVKSVENFEDFPEYGERHLLDLGFKEGDLLIAITEGGETPYVLGTLECALKHSKAKPWFVFCNPKGLLMQTVERSRKVLENPRVNSLDLTVGPMALSGSTRLQAATAQMLAVGAAIFFKIDKMSEFHREYARLDLATFLSPVIEWEAGAYQKNNTILYQTSTYPIAVLTDTTERSPTFSLTPFEKTHGEASEHSICYLSIPDAHTAQESWKEILGRAPRGLEWPEFKEKLGLDSIYEFDFGREAIAARAKQITPKIQDVIRLDAHHKLDTLEFQSNEFDLKLETKLVHDPLFEQILVKMLLNTLSLLVMGRMGRYEGNVMTWVRASNGKLIDRTIRYLEILIEKRGLKKVPRYELVKRIFEKQPKLKSDQAIILSILEDLRN